MGFNPFISHFPIISPYREPEVRTDGFETKIDKRKRIGLLNVILIDGQTLTGKSTLGRDIAKRRDPNYVKIFTVKDFVDYFFKCKDLLGIDDTGKITKPENIPLVWHKWILFDEIEVEANRMEYWSEKNIVLMYIISSFGWLRNHLVMTLPNIKGLSEVILTNVSMRITVAADEGKDGRIRRTAYIKKVYWSEKANKYKWITVEQHTIPFIEKDESYDNAKSNNFFNVQLKNWKNRIERKDSLINSNNPERLRKLNELKARLPNLSGDEYKECLSAYISLKGG